MGESGLTSNTPFLGLIRPTTSNSTSLESVIFPEYMVDIKGQTDRPMMKLDHYQQAATLE